MRQRRGNYAILFVLTAAVMMSYLAFSIDGGRMRVAGIQAENAAEAAALAALRVIREGGNQAEAEAAARSAADLVRLQRFKRESASDFSEVSVTWGTWDWERPLEGDALGGRWDPDLGGQEIQSVQVEVQVSDGGVTNIFGPAIALVSGNQDGAGGGTPYRNRGEQQLQPKGTDSYRRFNVRNGARAAFRSRDLVLLVDVSHYMPWARSYSTNPLLWDGVQDAIATFLGQLEANRVPGDRIAVVAYAGDTWQYDLTDATMYTVNPNDVTAGFLTAATEPALDFARVADVAASAQQVAQVIEPCDVGQDAFFRWYRHLESGGVDSEAFLHLDVPANWEYYTVGELNGGDAGNFFRLSPTGQASAFFDLMEVWAENAVPDCNNQPGGQCNYFRDLFQQQVSTEQQCYAWLATETLFMVYPDPRRRRVHAVGVRSPLACHDGSYWDVAGGSVDNVQPIPAADCSTFSLGAIQMPDGGAVQRYAEPGVSTYFPDRAYGMAGVRPGRALQRAVDMLENRTLREAEPTVVMIGSGPFRCPPNIDAFQSDCEMMYGGEIFAALEALDDMDANFYVIGTNPTDTALAADIATMANWTLGRGTFANVETEFLGAELTEIALDMKIQVVQ